MQQEVKDGDIFMAVVEVIKSKKGKATVVEMEGEQYVLRPADSFGAKKQKNRNP